MFYSITLFVALTVFVMGMIYKISRWFIVRIDNRGLNNQASAHPGTPAVMKDLSGTIFSDEFITLFKTFFLDVILQARILKEDCMRWVMHMLIFAGFIFLFFTHALDRIIVTPLFDKYYLTVNPFLVISGIMVLLGIAVALYRRFILKTKHFKTTFADVYALMMLAVIIISGVALELTKLTSFNHYQKIWYVHILACFFGLAYVPFSKMFHIFATPASLLANSVMDGNSNPANVRARQVMELDACTQCATCSSRCSVAAAFDLIGNEMILPSERMMFLRKYCAGEKVGVKGLKAIQQGICLCTNCDRCTVACPAGINLRNMWFDVREMMIRQGHPVHLILTPFSYYRGLHREKIATGQYQKPVIDAVKDLTGRYALLHESDETIPLTTANRGFRNSTGLSDQAANFACCFACENCSTVCPVVGNYEDPQKHLDLMPHQIMRSLVYGVKDLAMGSRMLWYCLTCYQCQEHCPQGVKVTDILYEIKNLSAKEAIRSQT